MNTLTENTKEHLQKHHIDFKTFTQTMISTHDRRFDQIFWATIEKHCKPSPDIIVDMGTGPGLLLRDLRKLFSEAKLIGVEAQPDMLDAAQDILKNEKLSNFELINHDLALANIQGISDSSVDICICSMLLHELQVPTILIDEMRRILRPGGIIIVYDWHRHPLYKYSPEKRPETLEEFTHFSEHCRYTVEDFIYLFRTSNFKVLDTMVRSFGKHILMVVEK